MAEKDIEEYLRSLEKEEQQDDSDEKPEIDPKQLGYALRQQEKRAKAAEKELEELRKFREETVAKEKVATLKDAGLSPFHTKAYLKFYGEVSEENLSAYKLEAGLEMPEPDETPEPIPVPEVVRGGFAPSQVGSPVPAKVYSQKEWAELGLKDPVLAQRLLNEKRVEGADELTGALRQSRRM